MDVLSAWIRHHTGGLIEETAIQPNPDLRLVLQDAVLLAARWQTPFDPNVTAPRSFSLPDRSTVDVETMAAMASFGYAELAGWRAVRLPYVEALHTDLLLPPEGTDPADVPPEVLTGISAALDAATPVLTDLTLPTLDLGPATLDLLDAWATQRKGARVLLVLDVSGSMGEPADPADPNGPTKLDLAKQAVVDGLGDFLVTADRRTLGDGELVEPGEKVGLAFDPNALHVFPA